MPTLLGMPTAAKPIDYGAGGSFRIARRFVPAGTTLAGILWTFRNPHATRLAVIDRARVQLLQVGAPTAAVEDRLSLNRVTGYTVADTTGSVVVTIGATKQKLRSTSGSSVIEVREANVAAGASGGTRVADDQPLVVGAVWVPAAIQTGSIQTLSPVFDYQPTTGHPLVLGANEGFTINADNALGAASGIVLYLDLHWTEVDVF